MTDRDLIGRVPGVGEDLRSELGSIRQAVGEIREFLLGELRPGGSPGVKQRLDGHDALIKDHEERLIDIEEAREVGHHRTGDRLWMIVAGAINAAIGLVLGLALTGGKHP